MAAVVSGAEIETYLSEYAQTASSERWGLLDMRDAAAYERQHVKDSTHIISIEVIPRMNELSPHGSRIALIASTSEELQSIGDHLRGLEYVVAFAATEALIDWTRVEALGLLEHGSTSRQLWKPSPCLAEAMAVIDESFPVVSDRARGTALDVGCGGGRDAVFLAARGWHVTAADWDEVQMPRVERFATYLNCQEKIRTLVVDFEAEGFRMPSIGTFDLITVARYLHRPLFESLKEAVNPGGYVVYHTFMVGCENTPVGRPKKAKFLLREGELAEIFSNWRVTMDRVVIMPDLRPMSYFAAQKPAAAT